MTNRTAGNPDWVLWIFCIAIGIAFVMFLTSCKKDDIQNVPLGIEGQYKGSVTIEWTDQDGFHSNTYPEGGFVTKLSDREIYLEPYHNAGGNGNGMVIYCAGNQLTVLNQFYSQGYIDGSGKYNGQINLELNYTRDGQYYKLTKHLER